MKKFLIALPVILCLILSFCVPVATAAAPASELAYYPLSSFQVDFDYNGSDYYFYAKYVRNESVDYTYSAYCQFPEEDLLSFEDNNGIITLTFAEPQSLYSILNSSEDPSSPSFNDYIIKSFDSIVIDPIENTCIFYKSGYWEYPLFGDVIFYEYETNIKQASNLPDVNIRFQPNLKGDVSRDIIDENGQKIGLLDSLKFSITNNSNFPVQYLIRIRPTIDFTDVYFDFLGRFDTFIYSKKDYIYDIIGHNSAEEDFNIQDISLYLKPTFYHYLPAKTNEQVSIPFSMINLKEGTTYYVEVQAWRNDYLHASTNFVDCESEGFPPNPLYYEIDSNITSICYSENFRMLQYNDIQYDHSLSSGGVLPYQNSNDYQHYQYMYDAKTNMDTGELIVGHKDLYNDPNSWLNKKPASPSFKVDDDEISSDVFSNSFSQVFGFVSMFLSWLPPSILTIFIFGFSSIVIIAIIKAVK